MSQSRDELYDKAMAAYGDALERVSRAYEFDPEKRRDLLQEIHLALWRSLEKFEARCSMRTWVYRIAHNIATSYVLRQRRINSRWMSLEDIDAVRDQTDVQSKGEGLDIQRLLRFVHHLRPPDRELMLLYLENIDAATIGEIMGMSAVNVRSRVHRIKAVLARRFQGGK